MSVRVTMGSWQQELCADPAVSLWVCKAGHTVQLSRRQWEGQPGKEAGVGVMAFGQARDSMWQAVTLAFHVLEPPFWLAYLLQ